MKVLHVITGLGDGGAEAVLHRLITHDPHDEHQVVSLTGLGKYGPLLAERGVAVTALHMPRGRLTWVGLRGLWRAVRQARPHVIQTWMYHADLLGGVAGRLAGAPVVWGVRNTTLEPGRSSRGTIVVARLCGWLSRRVPQRIVACAQAAVQVHAALGYDRARMVVIPNGYDLARFRPDTEARARLRCEWGVPDDVPLLGMVARFDPQKDHPNLIAALGRLRQAGHGFRVVLVGTGVDAGNAALAQAVSSAGLQEEVRLLGPRADIPAVMNALDVHVLSSAYGEAFPNVLAEAMACGTPCVTTDVGDAAQIVGETGWVAPPRDAAALAGALEHALHAWRDAPGWRARQQVCRQRIEQRYSIEAMVQRYRSVWEEAVALDHPKGERS
ncbi:putative glycosyltransferase EpsF [Tepidimonas alkaliphilus]|uniref:Putative glycosyltransferase EpsF n=1 Tax=Tepidimonas alkaliphilus TaxID=2588942 RepID=A0A554W3T4_9BURK|nr:glycosyltransferase [Tepidimonas alkaliphilus]TSE18223.1 putative glycosyltransferase EpsF [Tepidimonas alkaliphilus]